MFFRFQIFQRNRRTEHDFAFGVDFGRIDDVGNGKFVFQLGNAALDKTLAFFGGFIFGVFGQIAVRSGFSNRFDHFGARHAFKLLQFLFQQFRTAYGQGDFLHRSFFSIFRHTGLRQQTYRIPSCFVRPDIKIKTQAARKIGGLSVVEQQLFYQIL
ncbi:Uncharacterised protein [Neisseria meningitidis]|nr:Uncharacterised protein [Neisseria meningitidis]CWN08837.1 Uncharacterised protein [Neisseria meningitidis]CWO36078.1 Uncharacterised protein [Neisseria meningitidis]CWT29714.1 Uncharacterised protein [Neisseria meningitidis]